LNKPSKRLSRVWRLESAKAAELTKREHVFRIRAVCTTDSSFVIYMIVKRRPALAFDRSTRSSTKSSEHGELKSRLLYSRRLRDDCEKFPPVSHPQIYIARETVDEIGIRWRLHQLAAPHPPHATFLYFSNLATRHRDGRV
jgi:hypothetical protein